MGWRDALRKYGPAILTAVIDAASGRQGEPQPRPADPPPAPPAPSVVVLPPPAPVDTRTLADKWEDPVQDLARDILGYNLNDKTVDGYTELRDLMKLMDVGRRDEVIRDLIGKIDGDKQPALRERYGV